MKFIKNYYNEVVQDYERSFIGAFASSVLKTFINAEDSQYELYFTIAKFEENIAEGKMDPDIECFKFIESLVSINIHQLQVYHSTISALFAKRRVKNPL